MGSNLSLSTFLELSERKPELSRKIKLRMEIYTLLKENPRCLIAKGDMPLMEIISEEVLQSIVQIITMIRGEENN